MTTHLDPALLAGLCDNARRILLAMPATRVEIQRSTGLSRATVAKYLAALHGSHCHISDWSPAGAAGVLPPIYSAGAGQDAPYPSRSAQEKEAARRARRKAALQESGQWQAFIRRHCDYKLQQRQAKRQAATLWAAPLFTTPRPYY